MEKDFNNYVLVIKDRNNKIVLKKEFPTKRRATQELHNYWDKSLEKYFHWDIFEKSKLL